MWRRLFDGPYETRALLLAIAATLLSAWLVARYTRRLAAAGMRAVSKDGDAQADPHLRRSLRFVTSTAFLLVVALLLFPAFEIAGLKPRTGVHIRRVLEWSFDSGLKIILIGLVAYAVVRLFQLLVMRFEYQMTRGTGPDALERGKRARTLGSVVRNVVTALVVGVAGLMVLNEFNVNIAPVLTGAGIAGLAVGFGAQTLVRDVISGFFLILENQVRVGDSAAINGTGGLVEAINLRTIVLRDIEGTVHVFPNGGINTLANRSKDYSYAVVDVAVSYYQDPDRVAEVVRKAGAAVADDPAFAHLVLEPIEVLGIDALNEWSAVMKVRVKTAPMRQADVGRELRKRLMRAFLDAGFPIPFPVPSTALPPGRTLPAEHSGTG